MLLFSECVAGVEQETMHPMIREDTCLHTHENSYAEELEMSYKETIV